MASPFPTELVAAAAARQLMRSSSRSASTPGNSSSDDSAGSSCAPSPAAHPASPAPDRGETAAGLDALCVPGGACGVGADVCAVVAALEELRALTLKQSAAAAEHTALLRALTSQPPPLQPSASAPAPPPGRSSGSLSRSVSTPELPLTEPTPTSASGVGELQALKHTAVFLHQLAQLSQQLLQQQQAAAAAARKEARAARLQAALAVQCSAKPPEDWPYVKTILLNAIQGRATRVSTVSVPLERLQAYLQDLTGLPLKRVYAADGFQCILSFPDGRLSKADEKALMRHRPGFTMLEEATREAAARAAAAAAEAAAAEGRRPPKQGKEQDGGGG
ncbi:hypothetical protein HYH03_008350 [Edaphochlamys debaryana]|uniref:Uncharacterized protein n=1 Tax=Edaphochlamys debaryana TaxID=47281 RepID=A0A835Y3N7_9CHLO|nr:hypothetical protein HYH03_008350 [Edaphochlamys debaryana]|eukprot:KAG2493536.1 hypothetical protein HYH03_008350 [Edaphochlamys debaryana]